VAESKYKRPPLDATKWFSKKTAGVTRFGIGCPPTNPPAPADGPACSTCDQAAPNNCANCSVCTPETLSVTVILPNVCGGCVKQIGSDAWWQFSGYNGLSTHTICLLQDGTDKCRWRGFIDAGLKRQRFADSDCTDDQTGIICARLEVRADILDDSGAKSMRTRIFTTESPINLLMETTHAIAGGDCSAITGVETSSLASSQCGDDLGSSYEAAGFSGTVEFNTYCCGDCDETELPTAVTVEISDVQGADGMPEIGQDCETCDASSAGLWGGVLSKLSGQCRYQADASAGSRLGDWVASRGDLTFSGTDQQWVLQLFCQAGGGEQHIEWRKTSFPKDDPIGTYQYSGSQCDDGDCAATLSIT